MTFTPHLKRKLYKTVLKRNQIKHPNTLPSADGAGKDQDFVRPIMWHEIGDKIYATMWDDYATQYNKLNANKFVVADSDDATTVRALFDEEVTNEINHEVTSKYTATQLAVPTDAIKKDITAITKKFNDMYDSMVIIK
tara:strand:+ start:924 stop:1337 length:414 start_codon:yes stop_codon:yes gene_type:complete